MPKKRDFEVFKTAVELPITLYAKLIDEAKKTNRTLIATVILIMEDYFNAKNKK